MRHSPVPARLAGVVLLALVLMSVVVLALVGGEGRADVDVRGGVGGAAGNEVGDTAGGVDLAATSELTPVYIFPLFYHDYGPRSSRLGYAVTEAATLQKNAIRALAAGWYVDFGVREDPERPMAMEHAQMVRLHQLTACWPERLRDRASCPYVTPYTYILVSPSTWEELANIAQANPGSLWLVGNEMDRYDWGGVNPYNPGIIAPSGGQDEMLPQLYAQAYHEVYQVVKRADPTARVGIGAVIQATPARLEYLTGVWDAYQARYGAAMPVDVWNVHNFIFKERCDDYGADIPPGCTASVCSRNGGGDICYGTIYPDKKHDSLVIFDQQIRAFRAWMKARGQQNKPLIVSEYGIIYYHAGMEELNRVKSFLLNTFDYFMNTKDCTLGYPADECRLVQRWAWYSLDDDSPGLNRYSYLFDAGSGQLTATGRAFAGYAQGHLDTD